MAVRRAGSQGSSSQFVLVVLTLGKSSPFLQFPPLQLGGAAESVSSGPRETGRKPGV